MKTQQIVCFFIHSHSLIVSKGIGRRRRGLHSTMYHVFVSTSVRSTSRPFRRCRVTMRPSICPQYSQWRIWSTSFSFSFYFSFFSTCTTFLFVFFLLLWKHDVANRAGFCMHSERCQMIFASLRIETDERIIRYVNEELVEVRARKIETNLWKINPVCERHSAEVVYVFTASTCTQYAFYFRGGEWEVAE